MKYMIRTAFAFLAIVCAMPPAPAFAEDSLQLLGGDGGTLQKVHCDPGSYLVGFDAFIGDWNDRINPLCAAWDPRTRTLGPPRMTTWLGTSPGGKFLSGVCSDGGIVYRLTTGFTVNSDNQPAFTQGTGLSCALPLSAKTPHGSLRFNGAAASNGVMQENCPANELAIGIVARSGLSVDAIGLICGDEPKAIWIDHNAARALARPPSAAQPFRPGEKPADAAAAGNNDSATDAAAIDYWKRHHKPH